jgi:soluble lytic murein transglycosylase-like protein
MKSVLALVPAAIVAGALMNVPALAKCEDHSGCVAHRLEAKIKTPKGKTAKNKTAAHVRTAKSKRTRVKSSASVRNQRAVVHHKVDVSSRRLRSTAAKVSVAIRAIPFDPPSEETGNQVVSMIKSMSPGYGVPTWFALRIAKIESNYNPRVRGRAGEYGIFQIKCDTARGLGFSGSCPALADARTNIEWGLRHLSAALRSSGGNLKLAASKHNAGLGRRTLVPEYVNAVF